MALLNTSKLIYGAIGAGVLGGAGVGTYYHLNNSKQPTDTPPKETVVTNNIGQTLEKVGYSVLNDSSDSSLWTTILAEYNKIERQEDIFTGSVLKKETEEGLKSKCKLALASDSSKTTDYKLAKKWCVKIESIQDMLTRNKYTKLGESSVNGNKAKWEIKVRDIKAIEQSQRNINVEFKNNSEDVGLLEAKCKELNVDSTKTYSNENFEEHYIQVRDWCATKNNE